MSQSRVLLLILSLISIQISGRAEERNAPNPENLIPRLTTRIRHTRLDCSHFVNYIYRKAHRPYRYANSEELYEGVDEFERVLRPLGGDLIVWQGHVGIVTDPEQTRFVSVLRSGKVKNDDYLSPYWRSRGRPRFLRYVGDHAAREVSRSSPEDGD